MNIGMWVLIAVVFVVFVLIAITPKHHESL